MTSMRLGADTDSAEIWPFLPIEPAEHDDGAGDTLSMRSTWGSQRCPPGRLGGRGVRSDDEAVLNMVGKSGKSTVRKLGKQGAKAATGVVKTLSDPKKTKRLMTVSKLVAPVVAPLALKAVDRVRYLVDQQRAKKLGVDVDEIGAYRGHTGRTRARIEAIRQAVKELRDRRTGDPAITGFADQTNVKLADLLSATIAAAPMPPVRRRPVLAAVARELDQLESNLIAHLVRTGG